jgi:hypothetical protein
MKPLLRVVLIADALLLLGFGVLFLLTPWTQLYDALQLVQAQPALIGQAFGVVLIGFGWLALRAAFDGALTATVGRTAGHVNWIAGVLMLVWLIGLHTPQLTGFGQLVAGAVAVCLIVIGLGGARLAGMVKLRDKALAAEAAAQQREARVAAKGRRDEPVVYAKPGFAHVKTAPVAVPVEPVAPATAETYAAPVAPVVTPRATTAQAEQAEAAEQARQSARDEAADAQRPPLRG